MIAGRILAASSSLIEWLLAETSAKPLAAIRFLIGLLISIQLAGLFPLATVHISELGWNGKSVVGITTVDFLNFFKSNESTHVFLSALIVVSIFFTLGIVPRLSALLLYLGLIMLRQRAFFLFDADDSLLATVTFYFIFFPSAGQAWKVFGKASRGGSIRSPRWTYFALTVQLCLVYFSSGVCKAVTPEWASGIALELSLIHPAYTRIDFAPFLFPAISLLLKVSTYIVLLWELSFPAFVCSGYARFAVAFGASFHLFSFAFLNLRLFPFAMLALYLAVYALKGKATPSNRIA
jgi:hypothetical protein